MLSVLILRLVGRKINLSLFILEFIGKKEVFDMRTESADILVRNLINLLKKVQFDDSARREELGKSPRGMVTNWEEFEDGFIDYKIVEKLHDMGMERLCYVVLDFEEVMYIGSSSSLLKNDAE